MKKLLEIELQKVYNVKKKSTHKRVDKNNEMQLCQNVDKGHLRTEMALWNRPLRTLFVHRAGYREGTYRRLRF